MNIFKKISNNPNDKERGNPDKYRKKAIALINTFATGDTERLTGFLLKITFSTISYTAQEGMLLPGSVSCNLAVLESTDICFAVVYWS